MIDGAEELLAQHEHGDVPWVAEDLAAALDWLDRLECQPRDDWELPAVEPEAREIVEPLKYDPPSRMLLWLRERDPAAPVGHIVARLLRVNAAREYLDLYGRPLAEAGLVRNSDIPNVVRVSRPLVEALATMQHPSGDFDHDKVMARVAELGR